jgi:uncharacterized protein YecE (DUF72 family)
MFRVGTSGWQYRDWRGRFYPEHLPQRAWLAHYATRFDTVEVNNSFYRLPEAETFRRWREQTPAGFLAAVKASRFLTHIRRLREPRAPVDLLLERAREAGSALGPVLFQLPPTLRAEPDRLRETLAAIDGRVMVAFEFRHPSWRTDAVCSILDDAGAAIVLADRAGERSEPRVTGGWSYVRFHQGTAARPGYRRDTLRWWADQLVALPARDVFAYFNNDPGAAAPRDADRLIELLRERGADVSRPAPARPGAGVERGDTGFPDAP